MENKKFRKYLLAIPAVILLAGALLLLSYFMKPRAQREDYKRISSTRYDSVFLSMFPLDNYREEDFSGYYGLTLLKTSYCIPRFQVMEQYMKKISKSGNAIRTVYLGIRPDMTDPEELRSLITRYPSAGFEILLSFPSASYWTGLSQEDYDRILADYCDFLTALPYSSNSHFYFLADQEWLIANPANYESEWLSAEDASLTAMTHMNPGYQYLVTEEKAASLCSSLTELTEKLRREPETFPDLSDMCILFFGDSVIGNFVGTLSIPGVVAGLSGATVFNCGYGGNSAVMATPDAVALPSILDAFFSRDLSALPETEQVYRGISAYLADPPEDKELCFVINYGLNDYFCGYDIASEDPLDVSTFSGAMRKAVQTIRANRPDARIILCTPNFVNFFDAGTEPHGSEGYVLTDYVEVVTALSRELGTDLLDNYNELGITVNNHEEYLQDMVHPNLPCRYIIGKNICSLIGNLRRTQQ